MQIRHTSASLRSWPDLNIPKRENSLTVVKTLQILKRLFLRILREEAPQHFTLSSVLEEIELNKVLCKHCLEIPRSALEDRDGLALMRCGYGVRLTHNHWEDPKGQTWKISW